MPNGVLWVAFALALLTLAIAARVPPDRVVSESARSGASAATVARIQVLRVVRVVLFLLTVIAFTEVVPRLSILVALMESPPADTIVAALLLAGIVAVVRGFDRMTDPWTRLAATPSASAARAATARAERALADREHSDRGRAIVRSRARTVRSYVLPALLALVVFVVVGIATLFLDVANGDDVQYLLVSQIVGIAVLVPALTVALTAMLTGALRAAVERRLGGARWGDGWFAAGLFVVALLLTLALVVMSAMFGIRSGLLVLALFGGPFAAAIVGAIVFREGRVQEFAYLDRLRDTERVFTTDGAIGASGASGPTGRPDRSTTGDAVSGAPTESVGAPRPTSSPRESVSDAVIPIRGRVIGGRGLLAGAVTGAVGLAIGAYVLGRSGRERR